jgi:hypothetical protein
MFKKKSRDFAKTNAGKNLKFQNRFYWNSSDNEKGIQVKICVTLIIPKKFKILVSRYHNILKNTRPLPLSQSIIFQSLSSPPLSFVGGQSPPSPSQ